MNFSFNVQEIQTREAGASQEPTELTAHFTGISQDMQGDVIWDSISDLDFYLTEGSTLTGAVLDDESYAGEGGDGYCNVYCKRRFHLDGNW